MDPQSIDPVATMQQLGLSMIGLCALIVTVRVGIAYVMAAARHSSDESGDA